jgi:hypothetical protein
MTAGRAFWRAMTRAFRRTALPLAAYYAVTLAVPLANGAARSSSFLRHALIVIVVPLIVIGLACGIHAIVQPLRLRCSARHPAALYVVCDKGRCWPLIRLRETVPGVRLMSMSWSRHGDAPSDGLRSTR